MDVRKEVSALHFLTAEHSHADVMVKAKVFYMKTKFGGEPKPSDFELREEELPPPINGAPQPKEGETAVVSTAAGAVGSAVGSAVGQIALIKGCRVIGFTGSDEKVRYLKEELGFHEAFNYKKVNTVEVLKQAAPKGVDCFFKNVGGTFSIDVYSCMNDFGRVACCGFFCDYNADATKMPQEVLVEAVVLSVDPYMRAYMSRFPDGSLMLGSQVGKVLESKNTKYVRGDLVITYSGWTTRSIVDPNSPKAKALNVPDKLRHKDLPPSLALGVLGMPGNSAYFGFLELCQPKAGETVVVNTAAGAVGSAVAQIALIKGCRVIGFTGSDEKVRYLKDELGLHEAFNYKKVNTIEVLKQAAPKGVDCFFDNVGGTFSSEVYSCMNEYGRVACCGSISVYNEDLSKMPLAPVVQAAIVAKQLRIEGFSSPRWAKRWPEGTDQLASWVKEGKLKYSEKAYHGFEKMPEAFLDLLKGENTGKVVVYANA